MATKGKAAERPWYKVLDARGRSPYVKFKYSLPKADGSPGAWHRVEGDLVEHRNGFHLTRDPMFHRRMAKVKVRVFRVETEGEAKPLRNDDLLARAVRAVEEVPWTAFEPSGAMVFLRAAWNGCGGDDAAKHSWRRLNATMQDALSTAIAGHFEFGPHDFADIYREFNGGFWMGDGERYYSLAVDGTHGPNPSAIASFENMRGRKPLIVETMPLRKPGRRERLHVGKQFTWFDGGVIARERMKTVTVTSFYDSEGSVVACSYIRDEDDEHGRKIEKRYRITADDIAAYHKALKEHRKGTEAKPDA